jgi:Carboxypeptidase regulatory-like domain/TonB dependent receptor-like, beta-barrel
MSGLYTRPIPGIARVVVFIGFIAGTASISSGQVLYGGITGTVIDSTGAIVPGATVTITHKETNLSRESVANEAGIYTFTNVQAGTYNVKVSMTGFREFVKTDVPVSVNQISRVDVRLDVGALAETVTVQSASELLQTDKADVHTELKSAEITSLPLNQFRNYQALINLVPGATPGVFQNAETDTPTRSLSTNVNGQNRNNNGTRTDGATNLNIWLPHHNVYVSPAETIDTVNISTNNFDAEQGMAGGAAVTVITKSGTNQFRGSAFEFFNNDKLNATPYFFGSDPAGKPPKLPVSRNIYGGTIGGPIVRNRLFFFGSFEGYRQDLRRLNPFNVPNAALRAGDFSNARNTTGSLQIIYDPMTGNPDGSGRTPFPGNIIPSNRLNPIALKLLALYPLPNSGGTGAGNLTNNYYREERRTTDRDNYDVKVNFNRTSAHQIWGKFSMLDAVVDDLTYYLGPDPNSDQDGGFTKVYMATVGQTWTLGPTLVWDTTFGFSRQDQKAFGADFFTGNFGLDTLGIPGTNDQGTGNPRYAGYPQFETGFSTLGNLDTWTPVWRDERVTSIATNVTKVKGRHELRAGYSMNFLFLNHWQPEVDNPRGRFQFSGNTTALRGTGAQTSNFYNQYASFLLGLVSNARKSVQYELLTGREWQHGLFIRDRWQANSHLTLDLGLRWEYYPIMQRRDRGIERVDLDTLDVLLGGRGGNPTNLGLTAAKDNFAPRVGAIYRLNENNVFRAGYGVTYNPLPWTRPMRGQYPLTIAVNFQQNEQFGYYSTLEQGIPPIVGPDLNSGRFPLPNAASMRTPKPGDVDRGTIQSWNASYERRLPLDIAVDVAYVGARGDGGYMLLDINAPQTIGGGNQSRPYARLGRFIDLTSFESGLNTRYHSLQVAINRPFTKGLLMKGAYTLSKAENMADDDGASVSFNSPSEFYRNMALAGYDRTHNFHLGVVYQLPWQSNNGHGNVFRAVVNDWQVNGTFAAFSGLPFTVTANGAIVNMPGNQQTADLVGTVTKNGQVGSSGTYYDPTAWVQPQGVRFGNTGRNQFRGPGAVNLDMALFRAFPMGGERRLEFRVEAANVTNTPKFVNPEGSVNSGNFMRILGTFGTATSGAYFERNIRLGLRFAF